MFSQDQISASSSVGFEAPSPSDNQSFRSMGGLAKIRVCWSDNPNRKHTNPIELFRSTLSGEVCSLFLESGGYVWLLRLWDIFLSRSTRHQTIGVLPLIKLVNGRSIKSRLVVRSVSNLSRDLLDLVITTCACGPDGRSFFFRDAAGGS